MSIYSVNKVAYRMIQEQTFRAQLLADPGATLQSFMPALADEEVALLLAGDVGRLSRLGANHFLMNQFARFGAFGLTRDLYRQRIIEEYRLEYPENATAGSGSD